MIRYENLKPYEKLIIIHNSTTIPYQITKLLAHYVNWLKEKTAKLKATEFTVKKFIGDYNVGLDFSSEKRYDESMLKGVFTI